MVLQIIGSCTDVKETGTSTALSCISHERQMKRSSIWWPCHLHDPKEAVLEEERELQISFPPEITASMWWSHLLHSFKAFPTWGRCLSLDVTVSAGNGECVGNLGRLVQNVGHSQPQVLCLSCKNDRHLDWETSFYFSRRLKNSFLTFDTYQILYE